MALPVSILVHVTAIANQKMVPFWLFRRKLKLFVSSSTFICLGIVLSVLSTNSNLVPYLRQQESRNGVDERSIRFSAMKNIAVVRLQPQFSWATRLKASREQGICFPIIMKQLSTKRPLLLSRKKNNAAVTLKWMKMEFIARKPDTQQKSEFLDLSKKNRLLDRPD